MLPNSYLDFTYPLGLHFILAGTLHPMREETAPLSTRRAFLIHIRAGKSPDDGRVVGRVEHVLSGRAEHFTSAEQLWAFVFRTLDDLERKPCGEILSENEP